MPPAPTRIRDVRAATWPMRTSGLRARQPPARVVLGEPVPVIAEPLAVLRQLQRLVDGIGGGAPAPDRRLVENAQDGHHGQCISP